MRNVNDFRIFFVHAITLRLHVNHFTVTLRDLRKRVPQLLDVNVAAELLAEIVTRKNQRAAGVLLFAIAVKIRRETDLRLDLFLAVTEIIVGDERDDYARFVTAGELERAAVVVNFTFTFPAHPVAALAFGGLVKMWQTDGFFRGLDQMRRENDAARVSRPMFGV